MQVLFIRRFEDGVLVREDRLTKADMRAIFKGVWEKQPSEVS
jgi:hypothetical protein